MGNLFSSAFIFTGNVNTGDQVCYINRTTPVSNTRFNNMIITTFYSVIAFVSVPILTVSNCTTTAHRTSLGGLFIIPLSSVYMSPLAFLRGKHLAF